MTAAGIEVACSVVALILSLATLIYCVSTVVKAIAAFGSFGACWDCLDLGEKFLLAIWLLLIMAIILVVGLNASNLMTLLA